MIDNAVPAVAVTNNTTGAKPLEVILRVIYLTRLRGECTTLIQLIAILATR